MMGKRRVPPAGELRRSQIVTTFGPGAMIDLPNSSVMVGGLDYWRGIENQVPIVEERLQGKVAELLGPLKGRLRHYSADGDVTAVGKALEAGAEVNGQSASAE